jgi:hypothetical protein
MDNMWMEVITDWYWCLPTERDEKEEKSVMVTGIRV